MFSLFSFLGFFACVVGSCFASEAGLKVAKEPFQKFALPRQMVNYIEPHDLAALIKDDDKSFLVVDVRDKDYNIGKVRGSVNYPFCELPRKMEELLDLAKNYQKVVFHCHYSAVRGPKSAIFFERAYRNSKTSRPEPEILVLRGGFGNWHEAYESDPLLYTKL